MVGIVFGVEHFHQALDFGAFFGVVLIQCPDVLQNVGHFVDGVVAPVGRGAMTGDALHVHPDFHTAPVTPVDAAVGGLGGDDEFHLLLPDALGGEILVDDVLPAHPVAVLFLHGADHHDPVAGGNQAQILHDLGAVGGGSHAALLVGAAPAVDNLIGLVALIGIGCPVGDVADAHGIDVGVDGNDLIALTHPADHIAQTVHLDFVKAQLFHFGLDAGHNFLFLAAFAGVGDHFPQEAGHVGLVALGGCLDLLIIQILIDHGSYPP